MSSEGQPPAKRAKTMPQLSVIGAPFSGGQPRGGVEHGVQHMRGMGLISSLEELGWEVKDLGDIEFQDPKSDPDFEGVKFPRTCGRSSKKIYDAIKGEASQGRKVLTIGGDHSIGVGTVMGNLHAHPDMCCIWVDAHADINTSETTGSGNMHGMPLAFVLGLEPKKIPGFEWVGEPLLKPENLVYIGLRDLDKGERALIKKHNIKAFTMHEVDKYGIGETMRQALAHVNPDNSKPIHLSFDVDAMDPDVVPATGTPVRGGLTFREGHYICEVIAETGMLHSVDIVEVNPFLGMKTDKELTCQVGCSLARAALGETLL